ncbi:hypothetical protein [Leisingera caerulea]|uniref:hypothetical protein n=1 Tax=Leisingera caerulea TaxID=506591 RepID=UPI0021A2B261|nr:hypothetical protein [Leisingera caerulea]UWQ83527.1 hypothetical protein K3726_18005 [Leisingera caerulea]
MDRMQWQRWVRRTVFWHLASWPSVFLADSQSLRGNLGAYARGKIWLAEELECRGDTEALEVLFHEICHGKIDACRCRGAWVGGMPVEDAARYAGDVAPFLYPRGRRAELLEHYRTNAVADYEEECLVRMCCDVLLDEDPGIPRDLKQVCATLCKPLGQRWSFTGGLLFAAPSLIFGIRKWPMGKPLPGTSIATAPVFKGC